MDGIENFIPLMNFRVGATLTFVLWTVNVFRDRVYGEIAYLPINYDDEVCDWTLRVVWTEKNFREATITMTTVDMAGEMMSTKLNISEAPLCDLNLCLNQDINWNVTKGVLFKSEGMYLDILNDSGSVVHLPSISPDDNEILVSPDITTTTCIFGIKNQTEINFFFFTENSIQYERTEELQFMEHVCFNNTQNVLVNSTSLISSYMFKNASNFGVNEIVGYMPTTSHLGNLFMIVFPDMASLKECEILATSNGHLAIEIEGETHFHNLSAYGTFYLNLTGTKYAALNSTVSTQVYCRILYNDNVRRWNEFFLFPVDIYSSCHVFKANNCVDSVCALVFRPSSDVFYLFDGNGQRCIDKGVLKRKSGIYNVWEIGNLTNGHYFLHTNDMNGSLIFFHLDKTNGKFFPVYPLSDTFCKDMDVLNATDNSSYRFNVSDHRVIYLDTSSDVLCTESRYNINVSSQVTSEASDKNNLRESWYANSTNLCQNCSTVSINCTTSVTKTNNSTNTTIENQHEEIRKPSYISQSNNSIEISVSSIDNDNGNPNYDYHYHEVPEDDSNLHDYMIAVIVSLCVAIFAVIAVISTFFLLEFLSRRKQLRNTKIRPFVS